MAGGPKYQSLNGKFPLYSL